MHFRDFITPFIGFALALAGFFLHRIAQKKSVSASLDGKPFKRFKRLKTLGAAISVVGCWVFIVNILTLIFGDLPQEELTVSVIPPRAEFSILGYTPSTTMLVGWGDVYKRQIMGSALAKGKAGIIAAGYHRISGAKQGQLHFAPPISFTVRLPASPLR